MDNKSTILIIEDTESNIDIVLEILEDYDVIPATSGADALALLEEEMVDLILLDIVMPEMDGFEVCRRLKENPRTKHIPVIYLTAQSDDNSIEKAYRSGGVDYISKPFKPVEILARVKVHLELQEMIEKLNFLATRDSLTGVYNRRSFFQLAQEMYDNKDENVFGVMIDIDHFKKVNDTYGHHNGDIVLKEVTNMIGDNLPENSIFGRIGGEEFAVILQAETTEAVLGAISSVLTTIQDSQITLEGHPPMSCTVSSGIARKFPHTTSLDVLFQEADAALYQAKNEGRNRTILRSR